MATHSIKRSPYRCLILALSAVLLVATGGCVNLKPRKDATRYFVLTAEDDATVNIQTRGDETTGLTLGILPVKVADHLETPRIALRSGTHEILYSDYHRWGEGLAKGVGRVVGQNLAAAPGVRAVYVAPWSEISYERDYDVSIEIVRFEGAREREALQEDGDGAPPSVQAILEAVWRVHPKGKQADSVREVFYTVKTLQGANTYTDLAVALSESLGLLSAEILEAVVASQPKPELEFEPETELVPDPESQEPSSE